MKTYTTTALVLASILLCYLLYGSCLPSASLDRSRGIAVATFDFFCRETDHPSEYFRGPYLNLTEECLAFDWYSINYDVDSCVVTIIVPNSLIHESYWERRGNFRLVPVASDSRTAQQILDSIEQARNLRDSTHSPAGN